ncbi:MAG: hypothetical protein WCC01_08620 [Acidimicrobiia bacterium]
MHQIRLFALAFAVLVVALLATACDGSSDETTTTIADSSAVVFGRGTIPETVPDSFPVPDQARIGATLVDANRGLTEMILTFPADVGAVVDYYEENLPARGYEVTTSEGTDADWLIEFNGDGIDGVLRVTTGGSGIAAATVQLTEI